LGGPVRLNRDKFEAILNQLKPAHRRIIELAAWGIVLLALAHLCWLECRSGSELHQIYTQTVKPAASHPPVMPKEQWEKIANPAGAGNGLLKLAGYAKTNLAVENNLSFFYYWTSYSLYPRRIYVAPPDAVINNGRDIMRTAFNPDQPWLQEHDIRFILTYGNDQAGGETPQLQILPPQGGQAASPINQSGGN
jgi:hypothetical protein